MVYQTIGEIFEAFRQLRVLIIGDVMIDEYTFGSVSRLSPEAPVPVVDVQKTEKRLGGAANVALNVAALGASPFLCSVVGDDHSGHEFINLLHSANLSSTGIVKSSHRMTTVKHRIMSSGKQILRIDQEDNFDLKEDEIRQILGQVKPMLSEIDLIIIQDYDKGVLSNEVISQITALAKIHKIPVTVDPKFRHYFDYQSAALFKPNLKEFAQNTGEKCNDDGQLIQLIEKWRVKSHHERILVTLSDRGIAYSDQNQQGVIPAKVRSIADVSGAGDTVISISSLGVALGLPVRLIAELANLGGGIVCETVGVIPIDRDQLMNEALSLQL